MYLDLDTRTRYIQARGLYLGIVATSTFSVTVPYKLKSLTQVIGGTKLFIKTIKTQSVLVTLAAATVELPPTLSSSTS